MLHTILGIASGLATYHCLDGYYHFTDRIVGAYTQLVLGERLTLKQLLQELVA